MIKPEEVRKFSLEFEGAEEAPHFDKVSFRIKKKIFATLNVPENRACLKLSLIDQDVFSKTNPDIIFPVPNAWGKQGWTLVSLSKVRKTVFRDALTCAFCNVAPAALAAKYQQFND